MDIQNTLLDDLCAEIGYTATTVICAWYGRESLYVPTRATADHHLHRLIGNSAFERLVKAFGGAQIRCVPKNALYVRYVRRREVFNLLRAGKPMAEIVEATGLTNTHLINIRREFEEAGVLPVILRAPKTGC